MELREVSDRLEDTVGGRRGVTDGVAEMTRAMETLKQSNKKERQENKGKLEYFMGIHHDNDGELQSRMEEISRQALEICHCRHFGDLAHRMGEMRKQWLGICHCRRFGEIQEQLD